MKKLLSLLSIICLCLCLAACGEKVDEESKQMMKIQEKIEEAGYEISAYTYDNNTLSSGAIFLESTNDTEGHITFSIIMSKELGKADLITCLFTLNDSDTYFNFSYGLSSNIKYADLKIDGVMLCEGYIYGLSSNDCDSETAEIMEGFNDQLDAFLEQSELSYEKLAEWGNWYYEKNK